MLKKTQKQVVLASFPHWNKDVSRNRESGNKGWCQACSTTPCCILKKNTSIEVMSVHLFLSKCCKALCWAKFGTCQIPSLSLLAYNKSHTCKHALMSTQRQCAKENHLGLGSVQTFIYCTLHAQAKFNPSWTTTERMQNSNLVEPNARCCVPNTFNNIA